MRWKWTAEASAHDGLWGHKAPSASERYRCAEYASLQEGAASTARLSGGLCLAAAFRSWYAQRCDGSGQLKHLRTTGSGDTKRRAHQRDVDVLNMHLYGKARQAQRAFLADSASR